jgi:hypothetical protein
LLTPRFDSSLLGGVAVLEGSALRYPEATWNSLYAVLRPAKSESISVRLIPYFAWANRGVSHMTVWIPLSN